jgi:hypothetical protein
VEAAVSIEYFARRKREVSTKYGGNGSSDIAHSSPTFDWPLARGNHGMILFFNMFSHLCIDDAGSYFVDSYAVFGQLTSYLWPTATNPCAS